MHRTIRAASALFCAVLLSALLCVFSSAAEEEGYLFRLSGETSPEVMELLGEADEVCGPIGIYETNDLALIERLESLDALDYYEENDTISLASLPADEYAASGYWAKDIVISGYAESNGLTGEGVTVAIVDSGLAAGVFAQYSDATVLEGIDITDSGSTNDAYGHGTMVASVIADRNYGIAPEVSILPVRAFVDGNAKFDAVIRGVYAAVESGCDVINLSMAAYKESESFRLAVEAAVSRGIIVVAAVGNNGGTSTSYPAAYDGVIGVGAVDDAKELCSFSQRNSGVDVVAPGTAMKLLKKTGGYNETSQGTSFASPLVAAVAALAVQADQSAVYETSEEEIAALRERLQALYQQIDGEPASGETTPERTFSDEELAQLLQRQLRAKKIGELICATAEDLGAQGRDSSYGDGLVNAALFLAAVRGETQTVFLSSYKGAQYLSTYVSLEGERAPLSATLAFYDQDGRLCRLEIIPDISADVRLNNHLISGEGCSCRVMLLRGDGLTPVCASRCFSPA